MTYRQKPLCAEERLSATKCAGGAYKDPATRIDRIQVNPFFGGMRPRTVGAEDHRRNSCSREKRGVHPEALANHGRTLPQDMLHLSAQRLDDGSVLGNTESRPYQDRSQSRLELRIFRDRKSVV